MKKIVSVVAAWILVVAFLFTGCFTALAESTTKYWEPIPHPQDATAYFNGQNQIVDSVYELYDEKTNLLHIWVDSDYYEVTGWEFPLLTEGEDYEIAKESDQNIWLLLLTHDGIPYINVLVDDLEGVRKAQLSAMHANSDAQSEEKTAQQNASAQNASERMSPAESSSPSETATAATKSTVQSISSQVTETADSPRIPVIPIITAAAVAAIAGALGIFLYKKRKSRFTD